MSPSTAPPRPSPHHRTWMEETTDRALRALGAGSAYFLAIAVASWVFEPLCEMAIGRGASGIWATVLVAPGLLLLLAAIAALAIRAFGVRDRAGDRLLVGSFGVTLMVAAELVGGPMVREWGLYETLGRLMPEPSLLFLALLVGAVLVPLLEPLGRPRPPQTDPF